MDADNESDSILCTPPEIVETAEVTSLNLLLEKSKKSYEITYNQFMEWRIKKKIYSFSERVLLAYFAYLSSKYKSSTLWTYYSMLRSTLNIHHNINIEQYQKLRLFLKRKGENYQPKKAKTLSPEEINKFISEAPDVKYLATKVALIMGIMGGCRAHELYAMQIDDLQNVDTAFLVTVPNIKTKKTRTFTITDNYYNLCKKYADLRPPHVPFTSFFLNYQNGKCSFQKIGINKFGRMAKEVATYLKLPNPALYTGHCFRRSSAILLVDGEGDISNLKHHGEWKSIFVTERHIDESLNNKMQTARKVIPQVNSSAQCASTSTESAPVTENDANLVNNLHVFKNNVTFDLNGTPLQISNCSGNFTFNIHSK